MKLTNLKLCYSMETVPINQLTVMLLHAHSSNVPTYSFATPCTQFQCTNLHFCYSMHTVPMYQLTVLLLHAHSSKVPTYTFATPCTQFQCTNLQFCYSMHTVPMYQLTVLLLHAHSPNEPTYTEHYIKSELIGRGSFRYLNTFSNLFNVAVCYHT